MLSVSDALPFGATTLLVVALIHLVPTRDPSALPSRSYPPAHARLLRLRCAFPLPSGLLFPFLFTCFGTSCSVSRVPPSMHPAVGCSSVFSSSRFGPEPHPSSAIRNRLSPTLIVVDPRTPARICPPLPPGVVASRLDPIAAAAFLFVLSPLLSTAALPSARTFFRLTFVLSIRPLLPRISLRATSDLPRSRPTSCLSGPVRAAPISPCLLASALNLSVPGTSQPTRFFIRARRDLVPFLVDLNSDDVILPRITVHPRSPASASMV